uniref:CRAL-TRIO domain-containing protein n=1 Tax=Spongospora subterranea TaxID=70186 RepID=A0A0H5R0E0_9EUKA|eukprot:CRZ07451.1 hypothetical protein [Spongospora subterranea]
MQKSDDTVERDAASFVSGAYEQENTMSTLLVKHENEFRVMHERFAGREDDDYILYRFLKAFKFDVEVASQKLEQTLLWRTANDYEAIKAAVKGLDPNDLESFPGGKLIAKYFPQCTRYSLDRDSNIVGIICPGLALPNEIVAHLSDNDYHKFETYMMVCLSQYIGRLSHARGVVVRMTRIVDLQGLGMKHLSKSMLDTIVASFSVAQSHFVEHMSHIIVINAPAVFNIAWAVIRPVLSERTQKKVIISGSNYQSTLLKYIAPEELPISYGGNCTRPAVVIHDHEAGFENMTIPAGASIEKTIAVKPGMVVEWSIRSEGKDIGLSVDFTDECSSMSVICPPARIPSNSHTVIGSWTASAQQSGTALFKFDNSYSRFTSKQVKVRIDTACQDNSPEITDKNQSVSLLDK